MHSTDTLSPNQHHDKYSITELILQQTLFSIISPSTATIDDNRIFFMTGATSIRQNNIFSFWARTCIIDTAVYSF